MNNPYRNQPPKSFWRLAIGERNPLEITDLWTPKFTINKNQPVATLGSCFAQHISKALIKEGYCWMNSEPAPEKFPDDLKSSFNYDVFSARVGNIYTTALLKQWILWAFKLEEPSAEVWEENGRYFDPFRPNIEPNGFNSHLEVIACRNSTLNAMRNMFENCNTLIFTLGLTEAWINKVDGKIYPMCPGTIAGTFSDEYHQFKNYNFNEIVNDLKDALDTLKKYNSSIKFLLTVSPVPLTATATQDHVLNATCYSKSTLRAVAGELSNQHDDVDYFPSYEVISSFPFKSMFYDPNMRTVCKSGVDFVMQNFFKSLNNSSENIFIDSPINSEDNKSIVGDSPKFLGGDEVCEDLILDHARRS
jgi:hypothetical protein